jgi:hypothetical protein
MTTPAWIGPPTPAGDPPASGGRDENLDPAQRSSSPGAETGQTAGEGAEPLAVTLADKLAGSRRLIESVIIAVVTSTGVYLVGSVYTETYFGRMSIDVVALDLPPPYIALQAVHAVQSLLVYPLALLLLYLLDRFTAARLPEARSWLGRQVKRLGWFGILAINVLVVFPLLRAAESAGSNHALIQTTSALSEVVSLMQVVGLALLAYVVWLSVARRMFLLAELKQHRNVPVALVTAIILLGALVNTADRARTNGERLMTGASDTSLAVTFTMADSRPLPGADLVLVAMRNSHYFVVERQPDPPSLTPRAFAVPYRSVDSVQLERINEAPPSDKGFGITGDWFATTPEK